MKTYNIVQSNTSGLFHWVVRLRDGTIQQSAQGYTTFSSCQASADFILGNEYSFSTIGV